MDKYALVRTVKALIEALPEDPNDYPNTAYHRQIMDCVKAVQDIINPKEPQWFTEMKDLYSPSSMANAMIEGFDMSTLCAYATEVLEENLNSPEAYIDALQNGWVGHLNELAEQPYEELFLEELSERTGRPVEQYRADDKLVVLDYLRKEAK